MWVGPVPTRAHRRRRDRGAPRGRLLDKENGEHVLPSPYATDVMRRATGLRRRARTRSAAGREPGRASSNLVPLLPRSLPGAVLPAREADLQLAVVDRRLLEPGVAALRPGAHPVEHDRQVAAPRLGTGR